MNLNNQKIKSLLIQNFGDAKFWTKGKKKKLYFDLSFTLSVFFVELYFTFKLMPSLEKIILKYLF